jgi:hypothetical protein
VTSKLVWYVLVSTTVTVSESVLTMVNVSVSVTVACAVSVIISGSAVNVDVVDVCVVVVESRLLLASQKKGVRCGVIDRRSCCSGCSFRMVITQRFGDHVCNNIRLCHCGSNGSSCGR